MSVTLSFVLKSVLLCQVTGVSMQSVLVGENFNGCAFVCGSLSFMDKMSCGIVLYILQSYQSKRIVLSCFHNMETMLVLLSGCFIIQSFLVLCVSEVETF